jgi:hypothetical protein
MPKDLRRFSGNSACTPNRALFMREVGHFGKRVGSCPAENNS